MVIFPGYGIDFKSNTFKVPKTIPGSYKKVMKDGLSLFNNVI